MIMHHKKTILVADDDEHTRIAMTRRLEAGGYGVLTAPDGLAAMRIILEEKPDLIILDICMPIGVGLSVAERVHEHNLDIPIIFLTALKTPGMWGAALQIGAAGYLEKPYDPQELLEMIQYALRGQRDVGSGQTRMKRT